MKKIIFFAIAILILISTFTLIFTGCGNTTETETTTIVANTVIENITSETEAVTISPTEGLDFLHDYSQNANSDEGQWRINEDIYFIDGTFYSNNEIIFKLNSIEGLDPYCARLLGCSTSSDGTNYISVKSDNKIWILKEFNQIFEYKLIADDAEFTYDNIHFSNRTDRFNIVCNNDAVQFGRTVIYRSKNGGISQIDIWNDGSITKNLFEIENPVLITDYSGVYWLQVEDFEEYELTDLIRMSQDPENHPEHYINKDGVLEMFTIYS